MKKKRTLSGIFIKYIFLFCVNTIVLIFLMLLLFMILLNMGAVLPANYMEQWVNQNRGRIVEAETVTDDLFVEGITYGVYDTEGTWLYGSFRDSDKRKAWEAYLENNIYARGSGVYQFFPRDKGDICIVKYFIKTQAASSFFRHYLPPPDICILLLFFVLFILQTTLVSRHFSRMLKQRLEVLNSVTEKIRCQDLEIGEKHSDIREIDEALVSLSRMGSALKNSLNEQWKSEKHLREQIAALAHDIKTPLTVIKGNAELLGEEDFNPSGREYIRYIRENTQEIELYLMQLQEMLLSEKEGQEGKAQSYQAAELAKCLADRACTLAAGYSGKKSEMEVRIEETLSGNVFCCISEIQRAWDNIVSNGLEHALPETPGEHGAAALVMIETAEMSGKRYLAVRMLDRGPGFTGEDLIHAKEQFYQGDKSRHKKEHRGLGLYTASRFAARQGGRLFLENAQEEGYGGKVSLLLLLS